LFDLDFSQIAGKRILQIFKFITEENLSQDERLVGPGSVSLEAPAIDISVSEKDSAMFYLLC